MTAPFNYITANLNITKAVAEECSKSGNNEYSVDYYTSLPYYKKQLDKIDKQELIDELNDYGVWEDEELEDHNQNLKRIFWLKCGDIVDIIYNS
jgi:hypothetical protein